MEAKRLGLRHRRRKTDSCREGGRMQTMRPNPVLRRFDIYVYKDKSYASPVDKAQVPATATVKLFRQGATVGAAVVVARPDFSEVTV